MGTYRWKTDSVAVGTGVTTFTHGLGVAPSGELGGVILTKRTSTGQVYVASSNSQIVVLQSSLADSAVDICVEAYHSITK